MKNGQNLLRIQEHYDTAFVQRVEQQSAQKVSQCYQCGNCTASCAFTGDYDFPVNQIMRLIQLGCKETVLGSRAIWLCGQCQACTVRCPCTIDVARVMATLRSMALESGFVADKNLRRFSDEFLRSVSLFGRVFEAGLLAAYKLRSGSVLSDLELAPVLLKKGKLRFVPHAIEGRREVAALVKRFFDAP
ncbi:4Fe-4S dicluster domain-containing protein [Desulfosoma sp.]